MTDSIIDEILGRPKKETETETETKIDSDYGKLRLKLLHAQSYIKELEKDNQRLNESKSKTEKEKERFIVCPICKVEKTVLACLTCKTKFNLKGEIMQVESPATTIATKLEQTRPVIEETKKRISPLPPDEDEDEDEYEVEEIDYEDE